jgi:tetrahydromethanopterin S-methyltransferase subunit F
MIMRTKYIDHRVLAVRHCDDLKDIALKIKAKASELINQFKELPTGKKIAVLLAKLIQLVSGFYAAKSAVEFKGKVDEIKYTCENIKSQARLFGRNDPSLENGIETAGNSLKTNLILKQGLKIVLGLAGAFVAGAAEKFVKNSGGSDSDLVRR